MLPPRLLAAHRQGVQFNLLSPVKDLLSSPIVNISWRQIVERFVVTLVIVVIHKLADTLLQVARQIVIF